jgi:NADH:ubiquinone oxidoreductase subunit K
MPEHEPAFFPAVRRARIEHLDIYEISETELQILERGSPESILLNFAIFLISVAASFVIALLTTEITSSRIFTVFVIIAAVGLIIGTVLMALWAWYRRSTKTIFDQIRRRMPPEGLPTAEIDGR